jgi:hypothetical protein
MALETHQKTGNTRYFKKKKFNRRMVTWLRVLKNIGIRQSHWKISNNRKSP